MDIQLPTEKPVISRKITYVLTALLMVVFFLVSRDLNWHESRELHTIMEVSATIIAFIVGIMALVRFYSKKDTTLLFIGSAFLGTALLDGYHAIVTSNSFSPYLPTDLSTLIPWSWFASRLFLSLMLFSSYLIWQINHKRKQPVIIQEKQVYIFVGLFTLFTFIFFAFASLPRAYYPEYFLVRPEELLPAILFLMTLIGYLRKGAWKNNVFEHWLILALIISVFSQFFFMALSHSLFDSDFGIAHFLKEITYISVLVGLLHNMYITFKKSELRETRLRTIFETISDGIITTDQNGIILAFNQGAEKAFGYKASEVKGQNIKILMPGNFARHHDAHMKNYRRKSEISFIGKRRDLTGLRKDGTSFDMDLTINENPDPSGQRTITGIVRDITSQKQAADNLDRFVSKLEKTNEELEQFAYVASHDLKAPLRGIDNLAGFIREDLGDRIDEETQQNFDLLQNRILRMEKLLNDLLEYSRAGNSELSCELVNLDHLLSDIITLLAPPEKFNIQIACRVNEIYTAQAPLLQILMNIISNAIKHHDRSEGKITVEASEESSFITFSITDDGPGIPAQFHERIFKMFQTLKPRDEVEGSGMGLAVVKKTVESLGGSITITSTEGERGTNFLIAWPKEMVKNII